MEIAKQQVDASGTTEAEGRNIIRNLRDRGFNQSDVELATALGRPLEEVNEWMNGTGAVDDDVIMKARGIAKERGIDVE